MLEPSYHLPLREELFLLSGVGLGVGHDGDNFDFEIIPRMGLNVGVGLVGVLTPALRVPIIKPSSGVKPTVVSTHWPPRTAEAEQPWPRWQITRRNSSTGRPSISAARRPQ